MASSAEEFVIKLQEQVSGPAATATSALAQLEARIVQERQALVGLETELTAAQAKLAQMGQGVDGSVNIASFKKQQQAVKALQDQIAQGQKNVGALGASSDLAKKADAMKAAEAATKEAEKADKEAATAARELKGDIGGAAREFAALGGPVGGAASHVLRFGKAIMQTGPEIAVCIVALIAVTAVLSAAVAVFMKAITTAGELRDNFLKLSGALAATQLGTVKATVSATQLQAAINSVAQTSALGADKIQDYALQLAKAGLKGGELEKSLKAMADAGSAGGDEAAAAFLKAAAAAKQSGASVDAVAAKYEKLFGGIAAKQALSLSAQFERLKANIAAIFSGVDIEPLLKGIRALLSVFDQTSASGKALKAAVTAFATYAIGAFLKVATAAVNLYIAVKSSTVAWTVVKVAAYAVLVVFGLLLVVIALLVAAVVAGVALIALPFVLLAAGIVAAVMAISAGWDWVKGQFNSAIAWLSGLSLSGIGTALIQGLVSGISSAAGAVVSAITGVVGSAISSAKAMLGIHSPSRVFATIGMQTGAGMAEGVDKSADGVQASMQSMVSPDDIKAGAKSARASGKVVYIEKLIIGSREMMSEFREMLRTEFAVEVMAEEPAT